MRSERGGTFLGLVLGIVIGLGIAFVVSAYVAKLPVPLLSDSDSRLGRGEAVLPSEGDKAWDPNTPLANKAPAQPEQEKPEEKPEPPPEQQSEQQPEQQPEQQLEQQPEPPVTTKAPEQTGGGYFVQAGAFQSRADAESQRAKLNILGHEARVSEREQNGRVMYRVRIGPFEQRHEADAVQQSVGSAGIESVLVRVR